MKTLLVLMGGSGSGKTTVARKLEECGYKRLITTTTRPKRNGEKDGVDYHFVTPEEFRRLPKIEEVLYSGFWYGLTVREIEEKGIQYDRLVVVLEKEGAQAVKRLYGDRVDIVFLAISPAEMELRLRERGDTLDSIQERIRQAHERNEFDPPEFVDLVVENTNVEETVRQILEHQKRMKKRVS